MKLAFLIGNVSAMQAWDRSHFLEDLSGYETDCSMLYARSWEFAYANRIASERGHQVVGLYGSAQNHGSTTDALRQIFYSFKQVCMAQDCVESNSKAHDCFTMFCKIARRC